MRGRKNEEQMKDESEEQMNGENEEKYDQKELRCLFEDCIEDEKAPSMKVVKERIAGYSCYKDQHRSIYDKIRYWIKVKRDTPAELPNEIETDEERLTRCGIITASQKVADKSRDCDVPTFSESGTEEKTVASGSGLRFKYTAEDNTRIHSIFNDMITTDMAITVDEVMKRFEGSSYFAHLVKGLTCLQLTDKIRSLRKTFRRKKR